MLVKTYSENKELKFRTEQVEGPVSPKDYLDWANRLKKWRHEQLKDSEGQTNTGYDIPELQWVQRNYVQPHVMVNDLYLFDPVTNKFTVERYIKDAEKRYGTIDSVVIWTTSPNLGCDSRNSEDFLRCLPGGTHGIHSLVQQFHSKKIKVLFGLLNDDNGTRDPQAAWSYILPRLLKEFNADGLVSDVPHFTEDYWTTSVDIGFPLVFKPNSENSSDAIPSEALQWNTMKTAKFDSKIRVPTVSTNKLIEPRHMTLASDKWSRNKTTTIQNAFFNGMGIEIWENIFGTCNQMSPRDAEALFRASSILRCFGPDFYASPEWEPHSPCVCWETVYSSKFTHRCIKNQTVWNFINRGATKVTGHQIVVNYHMGMQYYDVWHGVEIQPTNICDGLATLSFDIEPHGYGCVFATCDVSKRPRGFEELLSMMHCRSKKQLSCYPLSTPLLWQELDETVVSRSIGEGLCGMVRIEGDVFDFEVKSTGQHHPCRDYSGSGIRYPWEHQASRVHAPYRMKIHTFYMDAYPVTEAQFKDFLDKTNYQPADPTNFLKHWIGGCYPADRANMPVTHVSIEDARAYAKWAGKRLPHEWEWQYVAQGGSEYRVYPWGDEWDDAKVPVPYSGRDRLYPAHPPADVDAHPRGRSCMGVYDMVGNVWQWTDVYQDEHTRAAIIRGGSYYQPKHNSQYFPQAYRNDTHSKYLLMCPSVDRSATIGFRCVKDTEESAAALGNCQFDDTCF
ncbi:Sulfatase-modifying factor 1 [Choanephora cucurbitarum]|uniref:Sulfatase-modifying factor 1 n=1 Tax=Choanephora cucurbitarum TaxID=101091 RepID=A0A1C7NJC1_9FUNG|nr:Sulfatase-modifying factor 1 [Choanephora cucurbitarum]